MFEHVTKDVQMAMYASMVRGVLLHYANHLKLLVSYGAVARSLETLPRGGQLAQALSLITEDDHRAKRPLTAAVVVNGEHETPGSGFFLQCRGLGYHIGRDADSERAFWRQQLDRLGVAPYTLESLIQGSENNTLPVEIRRRFITPSGRAGRSVVVDVAGGWPSDYSSGDIAKKIVENAREFGSPPAPLRPAVTPQEGWEEKAPPEPSSGLPG